MTSTMKVAALGVLAVVVYAAWAAVQILVSNPLAAVPGADLDTIYAEMDAVGETMPVGSTLFWLGFGVAIAVTVAIIAVTSRAGATLTAMLMLIVLAFGAPGYFAASFAPGMSIADAFMTGGGDHSPWSWPLYAISLLSAIAVVALLVRAVRQSRAVPLPA